VKEPRLAPTKPRRKLVDAMRKRFIARGYPRLVMLMILALAGLVAFGFSAWTLGTGFDEMGPRYLAATFVGYATFLLLIRVWIAAHRMRDDPSVVDALTVPDVSLTGDAGAAFGGGGSGGAGASGNWDAPSDGLPGIDVDADESAILVVPVILAVAVLLGSVIAIFYVVNAAPLLLAEVALDAALVSGLYRKLRKEDARYWLGSALRHTWKPAAVAALCLWITGTAVQWAVPNARSIGDVVRRFSE